MADKQLKLTLHLSTEKAVREIHKLQEKYEQLVQEMKAAEPGTEAFEQLTMDVTTARAALESFSVTTQDKMGKSLEQGAKQVNGVNEALGSTAKVIQSLPGGLSSVAGSVGELVQSFLKLKKQTGGTKAAIKAMISGLAGPGGIAIAVSAVTTLVEVFGKDLLEAILKVNDELSVTHARLRRIASADYKTLQEVVAALSEFQIGYDAQRRQGFVTKIEKYTEQLETQRDIASGLQGESESLSGFEVGAFRDEKKLESLKRELKEIKAITSGLEFSGEEEIGPLQISLLAKKGVLGEEDVKELEDQIWAHNELVRKKKALEEQLEAAVEETENQIQERTVETTLKKTMDEWLEQPDFKQRLDGIYNDSVTVFENMENKLGFDPYEKQKEFIDQYIEKQLKLREGLEMTSEEMVRLLNQADVAAEENAAKQVDNNDKVTQSEDAKKEAAMNSAIQSGLAAGEQAKGVQDMAKVSAQAARQQLSSAFSEVVSEAINSTMKAFPAPFNIALAAAAAAAAKALFNSVVPKFAGGGYVTGPGTATSDSIPAFLSNGEYVVNAATTAAAPGLLGAMNQSPNLASRLHHLVEGGALGENGAPRPAMAAAIAVPPPTTNVVVTQDQRMMKTFGRHLDRQIAELKNLTVRIDAFDVSQAVNDVRDINERMH